MKALAEQTDDPLAMARRYALWAIVGFVAFFVVYRLSNEGRHLPDARVPLLATAVASQRPTGTVAEQRQLAQLDADNLWESARQLTRQRFTPRTSVEGEPEFPRITGRGYWERRSALQRLRRLWAIAYGKTPIHIRPSEWERFLQELEAFDRDVANGTVELPAV
jgi:hypothetical protein